MVWLRRHLAGPLRATLLTIACASCTSGYGSAVRRYDQARYPEALAELRGAEGDLAGGQPRERARYALYRGLTHLALGDRDAAIHWLAAAKDALDGSPLLLSSEDAGRLAAAWSHLPAPPELAAPHVATAN